MDIKIIFNEILDLKKKWINLDLISMSMQSSFAIYISTLIFVVYSLI